MIHLMHDDNVSRTGHWLYFRNNGIIIIGLLHENTQASHYFHIEISDRSIMERVQGIISSDVGNIYM